MARYLVTGGGGFIGSHVAEALVGRGEHVRILDNFSTGKKENLSALSRGIEIIEGDVRDAALCERAAEGVEYVVHLAALHEVPRSVKQPLETHEINVTGILHVLLAARNKGVKRFVYASSSAVYGDSPVLPRSEETVSPVSSPYAASKMAGEHYCRLFSSLYGLETVCLRYFNVYGPRQDAASHYAGVIPKFVSALLAGEAPNIYGDGKQSRDFLYVGDCVEATLAACLAPDLSGIVMNIGTGRQTTVNELCVLLQGILQRRIPPRFGPPQPGDIRHDYADVGRANRFLSYQPAWDIHQGLEKTARWYAEYFTEVGNEQP
ncbi:MAG: SDR family oxidoreductase [Nitrospirae bacterium]|nr:SDR family oxidoreductase [Nitrospirota bacterium]